MHRSQYYLYGINYLYGIRFMHLVRDILLLLNLYVVR